jgi:hypothetical protein
VLFSRGEEVGLLDDAAIERALRTQTEPDSEPDFVPLTANVAPQLALFGGGAPADAAPARPKPVVFAGPAAVPEAPDPHTLPLHEQRALLRDKRKRLVAEVRRTDGRTYGEINAWLNRATGVGAVDKATIEQLERSVALLLGALDRRSAAR